MFRYVQLFFLAGLCISASKVCNRETDCPGGEDEVGCTPQPPCLDGEFRCSSSGSCINATLRCDFFLDCVDGSDEDDCARMFALLLYKYLKYCGELSFNCKEGK